MKRAHADDIKFSRTISKHIFLNETRGLRWQVAPAYIDIEGIHMASSSGIPVIGPLLNRIIGTRNERFVKRYTSRVEAINSREADMRRLSDAEIRSKFVELRERRDKGAGVDEL